MKLSLWTIGLAALVLSSLLVGACGSDAKDDVCPPSNSDCRAAANSSAGAQAVERRHCINCHDSAAGKMAGQTTSITAVATGVELYPPNLTNDKATGIGDWSDDQLATAMRAGLDKEGLNLCPQMTHIADMSDYEAYSIVKYLRALPPVVNKIPRSVCPPLKTKDEQK